MKKLKKILPILCACLLLFGSTLSVSAAESYPIVLDDMKKFDCFVLFKNGGSYYFYGFDNGKFHIDSDNYLSWQGVDNETTKYYVYTTQSGSWSKSHSEQSITADKRRLCQYDDRYLTFYLCSNDVYNSTGTLVFQRPLPIGALAKPLTGVVQSQTKVILTTAVVCLALLTTLFLLSKKLRIFLP